MTNDKIYYHSLTRFIYCEVFFPAMPVSDMLAITCHKLTIRVDFLEHSFNRVRSKCPLSALTVVRIERVRFRENVRSLPRDKGNCQ